MNPIYYTAIATAFTGALVFWALYRRRQWAFFATMVFFILALLNFFSTFEQMGTAKPRYLEWRNLQRVPLITYFWEEGVAIWYVVLVDGEPRMIKKPWSQEKAENLQKMKFKLQAGEQQFYEEGGESESAEEITGDSRQLPEKTAPPMGPGARE